MSDGLNRVMLFGNLGADPELRVTSGGQAVLKLSVATNESYLDRNQVRQQRVEWHRVTVWGRRAEALAKFLRKGARVFVEGRLQTSSYEKNGEKRYSTEIVAQNVILSGDARGGGGGTESGSSGGGSRPGGGAPVGDGGGSGSRRPAGPSEDAEDPVGGGSGGDAGQGDDDIPF